MFRISSVILVLSYLTNINASTYQVHKSGECNILALSGGGSFGMVEVGILSGLYEKMEIPFVFDLISGISAGGLNAGFLSYYNNTSDGVNDLYTVYANLQNSDVYEMELLKILDNWSIYSTEPLHKTLTNIINSKMSHTNNPYTIIGTSNVEKEHLDIYNFGELNNSDRVSLLLSTSAIPIVFPPQHFKDQLYVDGGVIANELIYEALQYINCDSYNVFFISASEHTETSVKVDGLFSYVSSIVKLLYHTFNYQLSEFSNNNCSRPIGKLTTCFPNSTQFDEYSILDFNNGKELFELAKNNHYCHYFPLC